MRGALALPAPLGGVDVGELRGAEVAHHLELLQLVIGPGQVQGGGAVWRCSMEVQIQGGGAEWSCRRGTDAKWR